MPNDLIATVARALVPRAARNALRKPRTTWERAVAKTRWVLGHVTRLELGPNWTLDCHPMCAMDYSVYKKEKIHRDELNAIIGFVTPDARIIDIGAHWGIVGIAAVHFGGPNVQVIQIEPSAAAIKILRQNLRLNHVESHVEVIHAACGDHIGNLRMLTTGAGGLDFYRVPTEVRSDTISVPMTTVDEIVRSRNFAPTLIKIDVDGFEEEVLAGAQDTLRRYRPYLVIEIHGEIIGQRGMTLEAVMGKLESAGYHDIYSTEFLPIRIEEIKAKNYLHIIAAPAAMQHRSPPSYLHVGA